MTIGNFKGYKAARWFIREDDPLKVRSFTSLLDIAILSRKSLLKIESSAPNSERKIYKNVWN